MGSGGWRGCPTTICPPLVTPDEGVWGTSKQMESRHYCERSEAIHEATRKQEWIAHMGNVCVKNEHSPFCSTAGTSSSRPRAVPDDARRSSQGRLFRAAAKRLGLELIEHVIMLDPSGPTGVARYGRFGQGICNPRICDPGFEPVRRSGLLARSNSHSVVARGDCTRIPLAAGRLERTRPFFVAAFEAMQSIGSSTRIFRGGSGLGR